MVERLERHVILTRLHNGHAQGHQLKFSPNGIYRHHHTRKVKLYYIIVMRTS